MKATSEIKYIIVASISYLTALLFIYAATSKVMDFENFQVQLGQSPMLSAFAKYISYGVIVSEISIAFLLISAKYRRVGLILSYGLMVMFTSYIYIILNYSTFIPCSCGGLLEDLSWNQHIIFNFFFILLTGIGLYYTEAASFPFKNRARKWATIILVGLVSYYVVYFLFLWSEKIMQYHNTFVRRFPHFPAVFEKEIQLTSDIFYFAGADSNKIYLGNYAAPLKVVELDAEGNLINHSIKLNHKNLPFTSIQVKVVAPHFFLVDGNVPAVFQGKIKDWNAKFIMMGKSYFSFIQPIDSMTLIFRATLNSTKTNTLGRITISDTNFLKFSPQLIQMQIDGVFDTDGQLFFDTYSNRVVYVYAYRNEYIVADNDLNLIHRGNTIDTVSQAKLTVVKVKSNGETKLAAPPLLVNKASAVYRNLLFINSQLPGQFENLEMWKNASIIDIYDASAKKYLSSFYIYDLGRKKLKNFYVNGNHLYALIDDKIVIYKLRKSITENYKN